MHASNLVLSLKGLDAKIQFRGMGGSYSKEAGVELALDYQDVALMGFIEVIFGFRKVLKYLRWIKKDVISYRPDALVLVDFGGFNMKVASYAKKLGFLFITIFRQKYGHGIKIEPMPSRKVQTRSILFYPLNLLFSKNLR